MAFTYGFYNSLNGDRKYNAEQISKMFDGIIKDGIFASIGEAFATTPGTGLQIIVGTGKAWFNHTWNENDAQMPFDIAQADVTKNRYDAVVLEINSSRVNSIKVITGEASAEAVKPEIINTDSIHQYPLAYVYVPAGCSEVTLENLEIAVGSGTCPFVTGVLDTVSIDFLLSQWNSEFYTWLRGLKNELDTNQVTNLQRQIEEIKVEALDPVKKIQLGGI